MTESMTDTLTARLMAVAGAYADACDLKMSSVGLYVLGDGKFFARVGAGGKFGTDTYDRAMQWFADNWPGGTRWPAGVPRPKRNEETR